MIESDEYLRKILLAQVYDVAVQTPLERAPGLSRRLGNTVWLKREDLQPVFSFKLRGAHNKIMSLPPRQRALGVICASAGNHAQGVALSAQRLRIPALIVMPTTTPPIKVNAVRNLGAEIILFGDTYDEALGHALEQATARALTFIHPYDDPEVIAGQGTIGMEILNQHAGAPHTLFVPVGGGGLIAGVSTYVKSLRPNVRIVGVEPHDAPTLHTALAHGAPTLLEQVGIFADGVAVRKIGSECFRLAQQHVDEVILVSTDEICAAIKDIFDDTRHIAEPSGALALAGLKKYVQTHAPQNESLVAIVSGANVNFDRLRHVAERAEIGDVREALLAVTIPEQPGAFRAFCQAIENRNITKFNYRYDTAAEARVFAGISVQGVAAKQALVGQLQAQGYPVQDLTDNEVAKLHVRYMVGGHAPNVAHELLYRFEFPERPGALQKFLNRMELDWNISMFHYRNHGSAYGRVLVGMQVPGAERDKFEAFLQGLGYAFWDETENPAYALFLR